MKLAIIAAILGWAETPETEGIFLQPEEAAKIDSELGKVAAGQQAAADLAAANETIAERDSAISGLNTTVADMQTAADTAAQTITARDQRIQELEAQVAELGKGSSGTGTTITASADEVVIEKGKKSGLPRFDSPEHPANQVADQYTRKR